jgi:hypothetical protein
MKESTSRFVLRDGCILQYLDNMLLSPILSPTGGYFFATWDYVLLLGTTFCYLGLLSEC